MQSTTARITAPVVQVAAALRRHRAASAEHRQLVADLSVFQSPAELAEISAIMRRHSDAETAPLRAALELTRAA